MKTLNGVNQLIQENINGNGGVTRDGIRELFAEQFQQFMIQNPVNNDPPQENQERALFELFNWDGKFRKLPRDYALPSGCLDSAFQCWMLPDTRRNISPLRSCSTSDFAANKQKRFCDFSKLMRIIESCARDKNVFVENPTIEQLGVMLNTWYAQRRINAVIPKGRVRRTNQLKWTSVLKLLRQEKVE